MRATTPWRCWSTGSATPPALDGTLSPSRTHFAWNNRGWDHETVDACSGGSAGPGGLCDHDVANRPHPVHGVFGCRAEPDGRPGLHRDEGQAEDAQRWPAVG